MFRKGSIFILCFLIYQLAFSQQFGGYPSSVKWKQINTDTVRIVFPAGLDSLAERVAALTSFEQKTNTVGIGRKLRKVSIVLQSGVTYSNGYVALGPFRSNFFLMPAINAFELGAQSWPDNLSIHEFRHVQQYSNFREGLAATLYDLFGEDGQALANDAAIPNWFFEGDAVYNETMLSHQGRGRLPAFLSGYRALYDASKQYSYLKLRNGSLKDFVPDHYPLGYMLVAYGREKYGMDFWQKVTSDAVRFHPLFYPLQGALKKYTGLPFPQYVSRALGYFRDQWKTDRLQKMDWLTPLAKNRVVDYKYPYRLGDGSLLVLRDSYRSLPGFYRITPGQPEKKIATRDIAYDDYFSYNAGKIVYAAFQPDIRWGNREYSILKVLDIATGKILQITSHTKYFTPDISHDQHLIAAVAIRTDQHCDLDILDIKGKLLKSLVQNSTLIYTYPKFSADDRSVFVVARNTRGEMSLEEIKLSSGETRTLLPFANRIIGFPVVEGDTVLYSCSADGLDEVWAYSCRTDKNYRLGTFPTGLYQSVFDRQKLVSMAFTAGGYRLTRLEPSWDPVNLKADTLANLYLSGPFSAGKNNSLLLAGSGKYPILRYPKLFHPFNFHSWRPAYSEPDLSFIVYGENVLNTFQSQLYYTYNRNEKYSRIGYTGTYGGWFLEPIFDFGETFHRTGYLGNTATGVNWNEAKISAGLQLPLDLSGGKQYRYLTISATDNFTGVQWTGVARQVQSNFAINSLQPQLAYAGFSQQAPQNIFPRWGQQVLVKYNTVTSQYTARQFLAALQLYLPGLTKQQSLVLEGALQTRDTLNNYAFPNDFPLSRGYQNFNYPVMWKLGVNYHFTLGYPDLGIGDIVYLLRVRANIFYDYSDLKSLRTENHYQLRTAGIEVYFDTKWWNQQPVSFGIRYDRLLDYRAAGQGPGQWQFILPVNLFNQH